MRRLAIAGRIQGLMTVVRVVTSYIKTPSDNSAVTRVDGAANLVSGFLGGMGGDAMIATVDDRRLNGSASRVHAPRDRRDAARLLRDGRPRSCQLHADRR